MLCGSPSHTFPSFVQHHYHFYTQVSFHKSQVCPTHYMLRTLSADLPLTHWRLYGIVCSPPHLDVNTTAATAAASASVASQASAAVNSGTVASDACELKSVDPSLHAARYSVYSNTSESKKAPSTASSSSSSSSGALRSPLLAVVGPKRRAPVLTEWGPSANAHSAYVSSNGLRHGDRVLLDSRGGDNGMKEDWITTPHTDVIFEIPVKHANVHYSGFEIELGEQNHSRTMAIYHLEFFGRYSTTRQCETDGYAVRIYHQALQLTFGDNDLATTINRGIGITNSILTNSNSNSNGDGDGDGDGNGDGGDDSGNEDRSSLVRLEELRVRLGISIQHANIICASLGPKYFKARSVMEATLAGSGNMIATTTLYVRITISCVTTCSWCDFVMRVCCDVWAWLTVYTMHCAVRTNRSLSSYSYLPTSYSHFYLLLLSPPNKSLVLDPAPDAAFIPYVRAPASKPPQVQRGPAPVWTFRVLRHPRHPRCPKPGSLCCT